LKHNANEKFDIYMELNNLKKSKFMWQLWCWHPMPQLTNNSWVFINIQYSHRTLHYTHFLAINTLYIQHVQTQ
jgi:hypothetical protein